MQAALLTGFGIGFLVGAQVGPIWLLCARSVLRRGVLVGIAIGAGAAIVDTTYAALGVAGTARLLDVGGLRVALGLVGAAVLVGLGARTLWSAFRIRAGAEANDEVGSPRRAFLTSLAATASNPLTIASWAAVFAAASAASVASSGATTGAFLAGIGCGSFGWFAVLSTTMAVVRRRIGTRALRAADVVAGAGLLAFGGLLSVRAVRDA